MTDETGKNDETKPAAEAAPKPSRRQIAMLGAAAPVLLTLPIKGARATGSSGGSSSGGDENCGSCSMSTFSAALDNEYDYPRTTKVRKNTYEKVTFTPDKYGKYQWRRHDYYYNNDYSCIHGEAIKHKIYSHKSPYGDTKTSKNQPS